MNLCKAPKQVRFLIPENQTNGKTLKQTTKNNVYSLSFIAIIKKEFKEGLIFTGRSESQ